MVRGARSSRLPVALALLSAALVLAGALLSHEEGTAGPKAGLSVAAACVCWELDNHMTALIDGITPAQSTLCKSLAIGFSRSWRGPFTEVPRALSDHPDDFPGCVPVPEEREGWRKGFVPQ